MRIPVMMTGQSSTLNTAEGILSHRPQTAAEAELWSWA